MGADELEAQLKLETLLAEAKKNARPSVPHIYDFTNADDVTQAKGLLKYGVIQEVSDDYEEQLRELFAINNPTLVYAPDFGERFIVYRNALNTERPEWQQGKWVYYPWRSILVHVLSEPDFFKVRTARNKNLITEAEQKRYYDAVIGVAGLSVGNSVALALIVQGAARKIKLADMDRLALSNTNRIRTGVDSLGALKVEVTARQIYELNPYAQIELFPEGITPENIEKFFEGLDIVIDEIDNLAVKCLIRESAKRRKIAVVMAADNGDNGVVDVERYDLDPNTPFFHNRMGEVSYESLKSLDKFGIGKMITRLVGAENVTLRMQESLLEMGKTIVSWPQLGGAALLNGSAVAFVVRKILNNQPVENNRALISLDEKLIPNYFSPEEVKKREDAASVFKKTFGL